jgi:hypothetical protein
MSASPDKQQRTMDAANRVKQAKRALDDASDALKRCRLDEKRLIQEQAKALQDFQAAQQNLISETVAE